MNVKCFCVYSLSVLTELRRTRTDEINKHLLMEYRIFSSMLSGMAKLELMFIHSFALSRCIPYDGTNCTTRGFKLLLIV